MAILILSYVLPNTYIFTKQVKSSINKAEVTASPFIVFKILSNHLQSMSTLTSNQDFSGFPFFQAFLSLQSYLSIVNENLIPAECFMQRIYNNDYIYILKFMELVIMPLAQGIGVFLFWLLLFAIYIIFRHRFSETVKSTLKKIVVSFLIAAYLLYPVIIQSVFSLSNCMTIQTGSEQFSFLFLF